MKNYPTLALYIFCALFVGVTANAAGFGQVISIGGYGVATALFIALLMTRKNAAAETQRSEDLEKRLNQSEKAIAQLQVIRSEMSQALSGARAEIADTELRRKETADMLAALRIQVERVARVDGLTGVANRQQFDISLADEVKRCVREHKDIGLLLIEIDCLVDFRDIAGEQKTEYVLQRVAGTISDSFRRAGDLVARVGEYKFAVLLPGTTTSTAAKFAEKMRRSVYSEALPFPASEIADRITVSVGLVSLPPVRLHKSETIIAMAENALREAQTNGCNQVAVSEPVAA